MTEQATSLNNPVIYDATEAKKHATSADPWAKDWLGKNSATFGPYKVTQFTPGQVVVFEVNPHYYRERPKIPRVIWREVPSSATRLELLLAGSVHIAKELEPLQRQQCEGKPGVKVTAIKGNEAVMFGAQQQRQAVRQCEGAQAIAYAAPIDAIIDTVYLKQPNVRLFKGYTPESYPAAIDYWPYYPTDLDKARALLKEAGQGPFSFKLAQNAARPEHEQVAIQIQTQLKKLDIDVADPEADTRRLPGGIFLAQGGGGAGAGLRLGGRLRLLPRAVLRLRPHLRRQLGQLQQQGRRRPARRVLQHRRRRQAARTWAEGAPDHRR